MSHIPVNHPLRPLYRVLAGLIGAYVLAFGVVGLLATNGHGTFARDDLWALWLRTNPAFSVLSIAVGAIIVLGALIGRNVAAIVNLWSGVVFIVAGLTMIALLNTDLNMLNWSMSNVITSYVFGLTLLAAGLYGRTAPASVTAK